MFAGMGDSTIQKAEQVAEKVEEKPAEKVAGVSAFDFMAGMKS